MRRPWSFLPLRNADAGSGSGGGAADAGAAAASSDAGGAATGAEAGDAGAAAAAAAGTGAAAAPPRPDWLPEDQWDATAGKPKVDIAEALKAHQTAAERAGQVPADAAGYKVELPEGSTLKLDDADPLLGAFREFAHKEGLTQAQFNGVLALRARMEAETQAAIQAHQQAEEARLAAELGKLGEKAAERIDTVTAWAKKAPAEQFDAARAIAATAAGAQFLEWAMQQTGGPKLPGGGSPATPARDAAEILYGTNR